MSELMMTAWCAMLTRVCVLLARGPQADAGPGVDLKARNRMLSCKLVSLPRQIRVSGSARTMVLPATNTFSPTLTSP